jgi:hypothetical protein
MEFHVPSGSVGLMYQTESIKTGFNFHGLTVQVDTNNTKFAQWQNLVTTLLRLTWRPNYERLKSETHQGVLFPRGPGIVGCLPIRA